MDDLASLLTLLAEAEAMLTRETETILAGDDPDPYLPENKETLLRRLERQITSAPGLAAVAGGAEHRQLCAAFDRLVHAATRNEAVLRGALHGSYMLVQAVREAVDGYPGRRPFATNAGHQAGQTGGFNRLA